MARNKARDLRSFFMPEGVYLTLRTHRRWTWAWGSSTTGDPVHGGVPPLLVQRG